jgi:hypothetical protein
VRGEPRTARTLRRLLVLPLAAAALYVAYRIALGQHAAERAADRRAHMQDHRQDG